MKNKWNLFWKDYGDLATDSIRFYRKHWFGCLLYLAVMVLYIVGCLNDWFDDLYCWIDDKISFLKNKVKSVFRKGKHEK